ncbi:NOL1/NOP2/sun family putative RNA methylase [Clostridium bovifaecis]|uniref:NOL1/NOP2/sun family putative RNA methylase n=1 Tax=Clostridium bovifaecis TaxID=2184719 RepID=A0A6I6EQD2_9CLOT|nr:NOL1/NOP2/sun family putative RNA methylase [Clostridium bovifaecis]
MSINDIKNILPDEFLMLLYEIYSPVTVDKILKSYKDGRKTTFRVNTLKASVSEVLDEMKRNGIKFSSSSIMKEAFIIPKDKESRILKLSSYAEGKLYMQNLSSMLSPIFLDIHEKIDILDMCAAPGSKTTEMAAMIDNKGKILANEIDDIRRERLKYNIKKQEASCVEVIGGDGRRLGSLFPKAFDRVLLDAPCSGEGTITLKEPRTYRGWNRTIVRRNSKLQKELLESGVNALKPGGILVYSTCTISPEENEEVVDEIINKYKNLRILEINLTLKNSISGITKYKDRTYNHSLSKALRVIPNEEMEGFFICKIRKK